MVREDRVGQQPLKMDCASHFCAALPLIDPSFQVIGSAVALLGLIAIGVAVGVVVSRNNSKSSSSVSTDSSGGSTVPQTDPNDPSTFVKDAKLHQSFYGIAYTPAGSQLPDCGNKLSK